MSSGDHTHHTLDYIELGATDMEATRRFYESAFGWRFNDYGPDYMGCVDGSRGATEAGGFHRRDEVSPSSILPVVFSDDLDATYQAVKAAGGRITKEIFEFPGGRRFQFFDPSGNELGVWAF